MTKEMKRPISNITQDSIKPLLSNAVEFYTNKNREAHKLIQERDEYINHLESQLNKAKPQQPLPVVPEFVAEWYEGCAPIPVETCITDFLFNYQKEKSVDDGTEFEQWFIRTDNSIEILMDMKRLGYEVEKPQLFYIALPKIYGLSDPIFVSKAENGIISILTKGKDYALKLTEKEIKSIDERYWQFAVPVEDGE